MASPSNEPQRFKPLGPASYPSLWPKSVREWQQHAISNYEDASPGAGFSVSYRNGNAFATIYVFGEHEARGIPDGIDSDVVREHFRIAHEHQSRSPLYVKCQGGPATVAVLEHDDTSHAFLFAPFVARNLSNVLLNSFLLCTGAKERIVKAQVSLPTADAKDPAAFFRSISMLMVTVVDFISSSPPQGAN